MAPSVFRGRQIHTRHLYGADQRLVETVQDVTWTSEDRGLLLALELYEQSLCPGCGEPKAVAWHVQMTEEYAAQEIVCHACTAKTGDGPGRREIVYAIPFHEVPQARLEAMPPFDPFETTVGPERPHARKG